MKYDDTGPPTRNEIKSLGVMVGLILMVAAFVWWYTRSPAPVAASKPAATASASRMG